MKNNCGLSALQFKSGAMQINYLIVTVFNLLISRELIINPRYARSKLRPASLPLRLQGKPILVGNGNSGYRSI